MYFGLAYYPEHWPESRWPVDAQMMQDAGVNGVRMGEFAWSKLEPTPGALDFEWLDRAIELLGSHGIKTMMCTCSRTPPPWVFQQNPSIRNVRADGQVANYGYRYTVCHNQPRFIELAEAIDRAVIEHYAGNPNVIAWHIDNEIGSGNTCYCEVCQARFHDYLREKCGSVENLNEQWGMHFWSVAFTDFNEVPLPIGVPMPYPSLTLEYARFQSHVNAEFARRRYEWMKERHPQAWVTTNFQSSRASHTDIFEMGRWTDVYGTNYYPTHNPEFALDYCRGARGQLMILEQRSGAPHWRPGTPPGWMRLWTYSSVGHGASGINYFRWRTARWGQEEYWHGVLPHSGRPNRRYEELKQTGKELEQLSPWIDATRPAAKTAIALSYESRWAIDSVASSQVLSPLFATDLMDAHEEAKAYHTALMDAAITTDALDPREDLTAYKLVIATRLYVVDDKIAANLLRFVEEGGVLCLTPRSGVADEFNVIFDQPAPGPLREMAGVNVDDYTTLEAPVKIEGIPGVEEAVIWADEIELAGAKAVAHFASSWLAGKPAISLHSYGKGKVVYAGALLRGASLDAFTRWLAQLAGVEPVLSGLPQGVRAYERQGSREGQSYRLVFLCNFSGKDQPVALGSAWDDLLSGESVTQITLAEAGVAVLQKALA
jgi:beta-galactosidase